MNTAPSHQADAISSLLSTAQAHLAAERVGDAAQTFVNVLALEPLNPAALHGLAKISLQLQKFGDAWKFAAQAANVYPTTNNFILLAQIAKTIGRADDALRYYEAVVKASPTDITALSGMAEIYEEAGYRTRAVEHYEKILGLRPHDTKLMDRLSKLYTFADSGRLLDFYERARPSDSSSIGVKLAFQSVYVTRKEAAERYKRGLSPYATSPEELFIGYAREALDAFEALADSALAQEPTHAKGLISKGLCALTRGAYQESEQFFQQVTAVKANTMYDTVFFTDGFFRQFENVDDAVMLQGFPPLIEVTKQYFADAPVIFLSSDIKYFRQFTRTLLLSIDDVAPGSQGHVHIMNATDEELQAAKSFCASLSRTTIAISAEDARHLVTGNLSARLYFHAIRFIRLFQHLMIYQRPLWLLDVDALMNRDPRPVFEAGGQGDLTFLAYAGRMEPWHQFNASVVGIQPTTQGIRYLRLVAAYISHFYAQRKLWWGIDQFALYAVFAFLRSGPVAPKVTMVPPYTLDDNCASESFIWCNGTAAKFSEARPLPSVSDSSLDSPRVRYLAALKKYTPDGAQ